MIGLLWGLIWFFVFGYLGGYVAGVKGRKGVEGFLLGAILGPLGILIEAILPSGG